MKIVHLCLGSFYPDNHSYQENMLPKYHKVLGHDVEVIASTQSFDEHGKTCFLEKKDPYINEYGIQVTRLPYRNNLKIWRKLKKYVGTFEAIEKAAPEVLFIHGGQFLDMKNVVRYLKKHPEVVVYVDNHADYSNSASNVVSKLFLHKIIWRHCIHQIEPYTTKFYGVLPARVDFLTDCYGIPPEKCELLVMGADDELVEKTRLSNSREKVRKRYGVLNEDFLIVTGGKINKYRPEVLNLLRSVVEINQSCVKLLFFGAVSEEFKEEFDRLCANPNIIDVGWVKSVETYNYIAAGDLVVFPGLHSVTWEQAVAQGKPCLFRDIEGFHHVDVGGNALFLTDVSVSGIKTSLLKVINDHVLYEQMKAVAQEKGSTVFSYKDIARRCLNQ